MSHSRTGLFAGLLLSALVCQLQGQVAGVHRELYFNLSRDGFSLGRMTNHPNFLAERPDQTNTLANLQSETSRGDDYGQRLRGYITAPNAGNYTFEISADETANFLLSTNENPAFKRLVAWVDPRSQENNFNTHYGQLSAPIPLLAGQRYYFEVLHHDVNLIDHLVGAMADPRWRVGESDSECAAGL